MTTKVAQYITVIDRSNKVIGNSRQFKDVFREAKAAYIERKAEIKAQKQAKEEAELQKAIRAVSIQDEEERARTVRPDRPRRDGSNYGRHSPPSEYQRPRGHRTHSTASMSMRDGDYNTPREGTRQMNLADFNDAIYGAATQVRRASRTAPSTPPSELYDDPAARGLVRARTDLPMMQRPTHQLVQSRSADDIDLDLAYGEYHPESLVVMPEEQKQKELSSLVMRCKGLLEEADCAGHSAKAIISHLQKNPDTLAAVGLTLAEISNIATKMAPGALGMFAKSAPGVLALLAAPEFLIAVGVAAGVTVIAIGGYKIIKRIKEKAGNGDDKDAGARGAGPDHDEALDVRELDRIERWRRGVPESSRGFSIDEEGTVVSSATSVEGEFISPFAAQSMGHLPIRKAKTAASKTTTRRAKDDDRESKRGGERKHKKRRSGNGDDDASVTSKGSTVRRSNTGDKAVVKVKKPSALSRLLNS